MNNKKQIIYVDMDGVLCDFYTPFYEALKANPDQKYPHVKQGFFLDLKPVYGAVEGYKYLESLDDYEVHILTAAYHYTSYSYSEKREWVEQYLGMDAAEKMIISRYKHLNHGHYLIDDNDGSNSELSHGQDKFNGKLMHFGNPWNWGSITRFFSMGNFFTNTDGTNNIDHTRKQLLRTKRN